jgi:uncharacterized membrane protein
MPGVRTFLLWIHVGGVVVWFGAIAYFLLVLRPAVAASGMERGQWYLLLRQIKRRLRRVVGVAVVAVVASGLMLAHLRGLLHWPVLTGGGYGNLVVAKMGLAALLVVVFATALPLIERIPEPKRRGRAFVRTHVAALALGAAAAFVGFLLHG